MTMNPGAYDTSRMYRSGSHVMEDEPAANAILACGEYLGTVPEIPSDPRAAVEALRQEIRTLVCGLSVLTAAKARSHRIE